jgi:transposase-like protein
MKEPEFCPNPKCSCHLKPVKRDWFFYNGRYSTSIKKNIQRYRCRCCRKGFSDQSFSINIGVKKIISYESLKEQLKTASGIRDMARFFKVSPATVSNRCTRLSRQVLAANAALRAGLSLTEDLAADGFESFTLSQYHPCNIHLLAGKDSQYLYAADYAAFRRKGRMTEKQKEKNRKLSAQLVIKHTLTDSFSEISSSALKLFEASKQKELRFFTDEKPQYEPVIKKVFAEKKVRHVMISGRALRNLHNDLFSVNYLDREIRKDLAEHVRQTVQFGRNANNCMERFWIYMFHHNYLKPYRINKAVNVNEFTSHADAAGASEIDVNHELSKIYTERALLTRSLNLYESEKRVWNRAVGIFTDSRRNRAYIAA